MVQSSQQQLAGNWGQGHGDLCTRVPHQPLVLVKPQHLIRSSARKV